MRQIRKLLSFLFLLGICFDMMSDTGSIKYSLTLSMDDVVVDTTSVQGTPFTTVAINNFSNACDDNEPSLPVKNVSFQVPTYCNNVRARILSSNYMGAINVDYAILPGMNIPTRSDFTLEPSMYATTGDGYARVEAGPSVRVSDEFFVNANDHIVTLGICPVSYDHTGKALNIYSDIQIELNYDSCDKSAMQFSPFEDVSEDSKVIDVAQFVENGYVSGKQRIGNFTNGSSVVPLKNYVILVPENLKEGVDRLSKWKEQKGYKVKVQTIEAILKDPKFAIGSSADCFDKESSVREWLKAYYRDNKAFFCLIVGDYRTSAPIRKFCNSKDVKDKDSKYYTPTDVYFSDLTSNWSFSKDPSGIYSCMISSASLSYTVPVGRLLCSSEDEVRRYLDKLLIYELFPGRGDMDYLTEGFAFQEFDAIKWRCSTIFEGLSGFNVDCYKDNHVGTFSELRPTGKEVINAMNKKGIMSWQGHGDPISVECARLNNENDWPRRRYIIAQSEYSSFHDRYRADSMHGLDEMTNENYPGVVYSLSCSITPFDAFKGVWEEGSENKYNMGSAFTVAGEYGGVALLGNTRDGYFQVSDSLELEFGKHLMNNSCIGLAEMYSKMTISIISSASSSLKLVKFRHNIIGDPEFNIWTARPSYFHGTATINNNTLKLTGSSMSKGFYGIKSNSIISQTEYSANSNSLSIPLSKAFSNSQIATVYVWQNNYLPLIQIVTTGKEIENENRDIVVVDALFSADANSGKSFEMGSHPAYLNVGANSNININALNKIASDGGIVIRNKGALTLNTDKTVLKGDMVKAGGSLSVESNQIVLEAGVTIEAGATAEFRTNKERRF